MAFLISRKAQTASSAATLVVLIAGFILLYILLLPAEDRQALLQDSYTTPSGTSSSGSSYSSSTSTNPQTVAVALSDTPILSESPGRIYYLQESSYEHDLSAVNLFTTTNAQVLFSQASVYIKNGIFDQSFRNLTFTLDDIDNTDNVLLSFNVGTSQGRLEILLNDHVIYDAEVSAGASIALPLSSSQLSDVNILTFMVSDVGYKFWTTNQYQLETLQITADVTDVSQQISKTTFTVSDVEKFNLQQARLYFYPDCSPREVGALKISINNDLVYSSIPDCQQINMVEFSPSVLSAGDNYIIFKAEKGEYLIYSISVKTDLNEQEYPVYYFDVDEDAFIYNEEVDRDVYSPDYECGDTDGYCPQDCSEDSDPDCCFEGRNKYWCDVTPDSPDDRCTEISNADASRCSLCASGYEDSKGYAPDECEKLCGDDHDNSCPDECSKYYDKDCCFDEDEDNFWCDEVPTYGMDNVCETSLTSDECDDCPSDYTSDGSSYSETCPTEASSATTSVSEFVPGYSVWLEFIFVDDTDRKTANIYVNGHKFYMDTYGSTYEREITEYVEPGSNAVKIEPTRTLEIRKLETVVAKSTS